MLVLTYKLAVFSLFFGTAICYENFDVWQQGLLGRDENRYRGNPRELCVRDNKGPSYGLKKVTQIVLLYHDICGGRCFAQSILTARTFFVSLQNSSNLEIVLQDILTKKVAFGSFILLCPLRGKILSSVGVTVCTVKSWPMCSPSQTTPPV